MSSERAKLVLETVPDIENQIREVDSVVGEAENVIHSVVELFSFFFFNS